MNAIEAGRAYVKFLIEDKELKKGLKQVGTQLKNIGKIGATATAPLVAGFGAATAAFVSAGSALADMSARTGASVETLSGLKFATEQAGGTMQNLESALRTMAKKGTGGPGTLEERFFALANQIAAVSDPAEQAKLAMEAFGKSGAQLLPILSQGEDGLRAMMNQASDLGLTMTAETAAAADALGDSIDTVKAQVFAMGVQIGAAVSGPLTDFLETMQPILGGMITWIQASPELVLAIGAVTTAVAALSAATVALGTILTVVSTHPILIWLNAIAAGALAVGAAFAWGQSKVDGWADSWDNLEMVNLPQNPTDRRAAAAADLQSRIQQQADAAMSSISATAVMPSATAMEFDAELTRACRETADGIAELLQVQKQSLLLQRRGAGIPVGAF